MDKKLKPKRNRSRSREKPEEPIVLRKKGERFTIYTDYPNDLLFQDTDCGECEACARNQNLETEERGKGGKGRTRSKEECENPPTEQEIRKHAKEWFDIKRDNLMNYYHTMFEKNQHVEWESSDDRKKQTPPVYAHIGRTIRQGGSDKLKPELIKEYSYCFLQVVDDVKEELVLHEEIPAVKVKMKGYQMIPLTEGMSWEDIPDGNYAASSMIPDTPSLLFMKMEDSVNLQKKYKTQRKMSEIKRRFNEYSISLTEHQNKTKLDRNKEQNIEVITVAMGNSVAIKTRDVRKIVAASTDQVDAKIGYKTLELDDEDQESVIVFYGDPITKTLLTYSVKNQAQYTLEPISQEDKDFCFEKYSFEGLDLDIDDKEKGDRVLVPVATKQQTSDAKKTEETEATATTRKEDLGAVGGEEPQEKEHFPEHRKGFEETISISQSSESDYNSAGGEEFTNALEDNLNKLTDQERRIGQDKESEKAQRILKEFLEKKQREETGARSKTKRIPPEQKETDKKGKRETQETRKTTTHKPNQSERTQQENSGKDQGQRNKEPSHQGRKATGRGSTAAGGGGGGDDDDDDDDSSDDGRKGRGRGRSNKKKSKKKKDSSSEDDSSSSSDSSSSDRGKKKGSKAKRNSRSRSRMARSRSMTSRNAKPRDEDLEKLSNLMSLLTNKIIKLEDKDKERDFTEETKSLKKKFEYDQRIIKHRCEMAFVKEDAEKIERLKEAELLPEILKEGTEEDLKWNIKEWSLFAQAMLREFDLLPMDNEGNLKKPKITSVDVLMSNKWMGNLSQENNNFLEPICPTYDHLPAVRFLNCTRVVERNIVKMTQLRIAPQLMRRVFVGKVKGKNRDSMVKGYLAQYEAETGTKKATIAWFMDRLEEAVNQSKNHRSYVTVFSNMNMEKIREDKGLSEVKPGITGVQADHLTELNPKLKDEVRDRQTTENIKKMEEQNLLEKSIPSEIMHYIKTERHINLDKDWPSWPKWQSLVSDYYQWIKAQKNEGGNEDLSVRSVAPMNTVVLCNICKDGVSMFNMKNKTCSSKGKHTKRNTRTSQPKKPWQGNQQTSNRNPRSMNLQSKTPLTQTPENPQTAPPTQERRTLLGNPPNQQNQPFRPSQYSRGGSFQNQFRGRRDAYRGRLHERFNRGRSSSQDPRRFNRGRSSSRDPRGGPRRNFGDRRPVVSQDSRQRT